MSKCKGCPFWKWVKADRLYQTSGYHFCEKNEQRTCQRRNEKMTRAEAASLKAYPSTYTTVKRHAKRVQSELVDTHKPVRAIFQQGYEQAEKDLGWISVKNRLPEVGHFVLACVSDTGTPQCVGMALRLEDGTWWDGDWVVRVDYWMEVPKLNK